MIELEKIVDLINDENDYIRIEDDETISFPLPIKTNDGEIQEACFVYSVNMYKDDNQVSIPSAWFKIDSYTGKLVFYATREEVDFYDNNEICFKTSNYQFEEHAKKLSEVFELYKGIRCIAFNTAVSDEDKAILQYFKKLFFEVHESKLHPFYYAIGQEFFEWIDIVPIMNDSIGKKSEQTLFEHDGEVFGGLDNYFE